MILPADKGDATVLMDRAEYVLKTRLMLEDKAPFLDFHADQYINFSSHHYPCKKTVIYPA